MLHLGITCSFPLYFYIWCLYIQTFNRKSFIRQITHQYYMYHGFIFNSYHCSLYVPKLLPKWLNQSCNFCWFIYTEATVTSICTIIWQLKMPPLLPDMPHIIGRTPQFHSQAWQWAIKISSQAIVNIVSFESEPIGECMVPWGLRHGGQQAQSLSGLRNWFLKIKSAVYNNQISVCYSTEEKPFSVT